MDAAFTPEDFRFFRETLDKSPGCDLENLRARCDALESAHRNDVRELAAAELARDEALDEISDLREQLRQAQRRCSKLVERDFSIPALKLTVAKVVAQEMRTLLGVELGHDRAMHAAGNVLMAIVMMLDTGAVKEAA